MWTRRLIYPILLALLAATMLPLRPARSTSAEEAMPAISGFTLPWDSSDRWMCSQGNNGITHQDNAFYGFDFWRPYVEGSPVLAAADGRVIKVVNTYTKSTWPNRPFISGNVVIIDDGGGLYTQYAHLKQEGPSSVGSNAFVTVGQWVKRGERIASVGNTGSSSGAHLHFQVQNGPDEGAQSLPVTFADVPGNGIPQTNFWYKPMAVLTDHVPPKAGPLKQPGNQFATTARDVKFRWTSAADDESGMDYYIVRASTADDLTGGPTENWIFQHSTEQDADPLTTTYTYTFTQDYSSIYWTVVAVDYAANQSTVSANAFVIDNQPPTGYVQIDGGAATTQGQMVDLDLPATDDVGVVSEMIIANDPDFGSAGWESYTPAKSWWLSDGLGEKSVFVKYRDRAGNQSPVYEADIRFDKQDLALAIVQHAEGLARGFFNLFTPLHPFSRG